MCVSLSLYIFHAHLLSLSFTLASPLLSPTPHFTNPPTLKYTYIYIGSKKAIVKKRQSNFDHGNEADRVFARTSAMAADGKSPSIMPLSGAMSGAKSFGSSSELTALDTGNASASGTMGSPEPGQPSPPPPHAPAAPTQALQPPPPMQR